MISAAHAVLGPFTEPTAGYWQELLPCGTPLGHARPPFRLGYPVALPSRRGLVLPLRALPDGHHAVASLIANQASFVVIDAIARVMTDLARPAKADIIVGMPTLGLTFAPLVAQGLGHTRYVPLGTSRKFWYDEALSEPVCSITSPGGGKRLYLDPNAAPLLAGKCVAIVDDAVSTGASLMAGYRLLRRIGIDVASVVVAMKQTNRWQAPLAATDPALAASVRGVFGCPLFALGDDGWMPVEGTLPATP